MSKKALKAFGDLSSWTDHQVRRIFGGKILGLYQAHKLNLPIPKTWLLSSEHLDSFLTKNTEITNFKNQAKEFLDLLLSEDMSDLPHQLFAVRSSSQFEDSANMSFAGIFESKLNVSQANLSQAIAEVWDSCHCFRAASYTKNESKIRMSVIIQPMIIPKYSGVCFSKHPFPSSVIENQNIVIEFASTSGDKVVQGQINPLRLSGTIPQLLEATDVNWMPSLLSVLLSLKEQCRHEVDIEFIVDERETLWLLQQRPISVVHASHIFNLNYYKRKYKRALLTLDIELLIEGCSKFLAPYLEVSYQLDHLMVMITSDEGIQELWIHDLLNDSIINKIIQKTEEESDYLERIENRYKIYFKKILNHSYKDFFDSSIPLSTRFFEWVDFITPLCAHYYVPILMIEAIHLLLKKRMEFIDLKNAEKELFILGTHGIDSLMGLFNKELYQLKQNPSQDDFKNLSIKYGFLKCRHPYEEGYSPQDIQFLYEQVKEDPLINLSKSTSNVDSLYQKYFKDEKDAKIFKHFKEWMRIRNQEMEYMMFAVLQSRPLFEEISKHLNVSIRHLWSTSKELIFKALNNPSTSLIPFSKHLITIYRHFGKTRINSHLRIIKPHSTNEKTRLFGKTVWGEGQMTLKVRKIFDIAQFYEMNFTSENKNEVLVTGMTTPDFIPYIKNNFSALITDEGGILCHAAIVAREISIPCIVGTGYATEILQEGTLIRIDFDRAEIALMDG